MARIFAVDIETTSVDFKKPNTFPDDIHCICVEDVTTGETKSFVMPTTFGHAADEFRAWVAGVDRLVMHNGIAFDAPVIRHHLGADLIPAEKVIDTLILSRLFRFDRPRYGNDIGDHSLKAWGIRLGVLKGDIKEDGKVDWDTFTSEMLEYCEQDAKVTAALFRHFAPQMRENSWKKSMRIEHDIQTLLRRSTDHGFGFNKYEAERMLGQIRHDKEKVEVKIAEAFPPKLIVDKTIKYRVKQDGTLFKNVEEAIAGHVKTDRVGGDLLCYVLEPFNPGSPKQRVDVLWQAGWDPTERTKTHEGALRELRNAKRKRASAAEIEKIEERLKDFAHYGWTVGEENLATLPDSAPEGARALSEWLTLDGRESSIVEWLGCYNEETGCIHGNFQSLGAWTQRLSHSNPNQANISKPSVSVELDDDGWYLKKQLICAPHFSKVEAHEVAHAYVKDVTPVEYVKAKYDGRMRALWHAPNGAIQVGTDAEGAQLRILAHYMQSEEYADAIVNGRKEDLTDIHNVNLRALAVSGASRDTAKTFIYAWLLGAGNEKVGRILGVPSARGKKAADDFVNNVPGLLHLKKTIVPAHAKAGFFHALDGRKVYVPSEHHTLAGMLQSGEALVMKHATPKWMADVAALGIRAELMTWPHDEWQTAVYGSMEEAEEVARLQREAITWAGAELGVMCRMDGSSDIGTNWLECH